MEDINKAANVSSVVHMDGPSEPSTESGLRPKLLHEVIRSATNVRPIAIQ